MRCPIQPFPGDFDEQQELQTSKIILPLDHPLARFAWLGCASASLTRTSTSQYQSLAPSVDVLVFASDRDVPPGYEVIGIVDDVDPGKFHVRTLADALPDLKTKAREVGANALIVDQTQSTKSGIWSTGISVRARAIVSARRRAPRALEVNRLVRYRIPSSTFAVSSVWRLPPGPHALTMASLSAVPNEARAHPGPARNRAAGGPALDKSATGR